MEMPMMPIGCGRRPRPRLLTQGDELVDHHPHGVVPGMGVPVPTATVGRHQGHRREGATADPQGEGPGGRHAGQYAGVVAPVTVKGHDERQDAPGTVAGRVSEGVAHRPPAGLRVEGAGQLKARRREGRHRADDVTVPFELEQSLVSRDDAVRDELHRGDAPGDHGGGGAEPPGQELAATEAMLRPLRRGRPASHAGKLYRIPIYRQPDYCRPRRAGGGGRIPQARRAARATSRSRRARRILASVVWGQ